MVKSGGAVVGNVYPDAGGLEEIYQVPNCQSSVIIPFHLYWFISAYIAKFQSPVVISSLVIFTNPVYRTSAESRTQLHRHRPLLWPGKVGSCTYFEYLNRHGSSYFMAVISKHINYLKNFIRYDSNYLGSDLRRFWGRPCGEFHATLTTSAPRSTLSSWLSGLSMLSSLFAVLYFFCERWADTAPPGRPPLTSRKREFWQSLISRWNDYSCRKSEICFFVGWKSIKQNIHFHKI